MVCSTCKCLQYTQGRIFLIKGHLTNGLLDIPVTIFYLNISEMAIVYINVGHKRNLT